MQPVEVKTARSYFYRMGCLGVFFVGVGAVMLLSGVSRAASGRGGGGFILTGLLFCCVPVVVILVDRRKWVRRFGAAGVTLRSGKHHPWAGFERVVTVTMPGGRVQRHELVFQTGRGRIFPLVTENAPEVEAIVGALARRLDPFAAPQGPAAPPGQYAPAYAPGPYWPAGQPRR